MRIIHCSTESICTSTDNPYYGGSNADPQCISVPFALTVDNFVLYLSLLISQGPSYGWLLEIPVGHHFCCPLAVNLHLIDMWLQLVPQKRLNDSPSELQILSFVGSARYGMARSRHLSEKVRARLVLRRFWWCLSKPANRSSCFGQCYTLTGLIHNVFQLFTPDKWINFSRAHFITSKRADGATQLPCNI
jgi:hypothetical protein